MLTKKIKAKYELEKIGEHLPKNSYIRSSIHQAVLSIDPMYRFVSLHLRILQIGRIT